MGKKALVIIDVLNDFIHPEGALYCGASGRAILPDVLRLRNEFLQKGDPVLYLCDAHPEEDTEFEFFPPHARVGTWGARIVPDLTPVAGCQVLTKRKYSALFGTRLLEALETEGVTEVWLAGVVTSICIMDTAGDLNNRDYRVVVPESCVGDFDPECHRRALLRMETIYGARILWKEGGNQENTKVHPEISPEAQES